MYEVALVVDPDEAIVCVPLVSAPLKTKLLPALVITALVALTVDEPVVKDVTKFPWVGDAPSCVSDDDESTDTVSDPPVPCV